MDWLPLFRSLAPYDDHAEAKNIPKRHSLSVLLANKFGTAKASSRDDVPVAEQPASWAGVADFVVQHLVGVWKRIVPNQVPCRTCEVTFSGVRGSSGNFVDS